MFMQQKNRTVVKISGREYQITGTEPEEYIHRVAIYVDRKIQELTKACPQLSSSDASVLAAVNIADELLKLREEYTALDERLSQLRELPRTENKTIQPQKRPFETEKAKEIYSK